MIIDREKQHSLAIKNLSSLLRGITLEHNGGVYCINYPHSFRTKNKFKAHNNICKNND